MFQIFQSIRILILDLIPDPGLIFQLLKIVRLDIFDISANPQPASFQPFNFWASAEVCALMSALPVVEALVFITSRT